MSFKRNGTFSKRSHHPIVPRPALGQREEVRNCLVKLTLVHSPERYSVFINLTISFAALEAARRVLTLALPNWRSSEWATLSRPETTLDWIISFFRSSVRSLPVLVFDFTGFCFHDSERRGGTLGNRALGASLRVIISHGFGGTTIW